MLIMENSEEVLQILERFTKLKQKDIPKELEDYLCYVAKTGDTVYRWSNIKYLFREKLVHVIKDFHDTTPSIDDLPQYPNVDPFNYETMKSSLLERLEMFNAAPFTVQRLCELLTDPRKQYSRIDKFMRALEKNILVVSTVEPGRKQPESENGDSLDSVVNGDLSLDVNVDIDMESESIFSMEGQNTTTVVAATSSSSSVQTKSDDAEDSAASLPKKPKLDIGIEDNTESKTKSDSESESETSDDSDSSDSKETKEESEISQSNKQETCEVHTTGVVTAPEKTDDSEKGNQCGIKIEKVEGSVKLFDTNEAQAVREEGSTKEIKINSKKSDNDSKNETNDTSASASDSVATSTVLENPEALKKEKEESKEEQKDEGSSVEEISNLENQQSNKADSTNSCMKESEKLELETNKVDEIEQNLENQETNIPTDISSNLVTEGDATQSTELTVNDAVGLIEKDNSNIALTYPECNDAVSSSSSSSSSSTTPPTTDVGKISEQMSVEDSSPSSTLLLSQIQQTAVMTANVNDTPSTNTGTGSQQVRDQPMMDENLDTGINVCTMAATGNSTVSSGTDNLAAVVDELMQSESEQMSTDVTIIKLGDDNIDLSGMDVDDTSQEEAMDQ